MTATADLILERRRVRRRLAFWRILAIVAIVVAIVSFLPRVGAGPGAHVARITIDGIILEEPGREEAILELAEEEAVRALVVRVNSPGGTVVASEDIYKALRRVSAEKPVVAVMDEVAASGGYIAALGADRIFASGNTLTGSIGVVMEAPNIGELLDMLGVDVARIKSGPLKAEPSLIEPPSPETLSAQRALIEDTFAWFRGLVAERRALSGKALAQVSDGRTFTGRQALGLGLIDALGDEDSARDWLAEAHGIGRGLEVVDRRWDSVDLPWPLRHIDKGAAILGQVERLATAWPRLYALLQ